ncbi:MAG: glycoside hydrolase family 127 protein [Anaerolineae bacterium]|nr:glycoside hydrolase family 127 protein [Anaerolineae bacterium]
MFNLSRTLGPVPFTRVNLLDSFWAPRQEVNREATIPHEYEQCERTGRIAAWDLTWKPGDPNPPHIFWDSDVAKWIEAASNSLATHYDANLDGLLDALIGKIARAQQPDGYLNSHFIAVEPEKRWTNLRDAHELYCAGHLMEAAVAHYQATGKRSLLDAARRYADHIDATFGREPGQKRGYCGHEEIELALVKLLHATGEPRYLRLAQYFIDERGRRPYYYDEEARARGEDPTRFWAKTYAYMQAHVPMREQTEVTGHAVRATYLYCALADLARETADVESFNVCERLWRHLCTKRLYVTGGLGSAAANEGFTTDYDLPDDTAYAETCAAIGLVFWGHRMLQLTGDAQYADVAERVLYNGVLSGVSLDGRHFLYVNPLASRGEHRRQEWFGCACCPPNIARLITSIGGYFYSQDENTAWIHLFAQGEGRLEINGHEVVIRQSTSYPWEGLVKITVLPPSPMAFTLHVRVPTWCDDWRLSVNGDLAAAAAAIPRTDGVSMNNGYIGISRRWEPGDEVSLQMAMPVRYVHAHPKVRQMLGRAALQRGPIVYCLEGADHPGIPLDRIALPAGDPSGWQAEHRADFLGGVTMLRGAGMVIEEGEWGDTLYQYRPPETRPVNLVAVPYCVWNNRAPGEMRVWFRTTTVAPQ